MNRCIVDRIFLDPHPNPDLRIGHILGHTIVVGDHYLDETLGIYIPVGAIIPDNLAEEMWVKGRLGGKRKNVVKERTIAGVTSSGLFYGSRYWVRPSPQDDIVWIDSPSWNPKWEAGDDVTDEIGVTFLERV